MSFWKNVLGRPGLWIAAGAAIGVVGTAAILNKAGIATAHAEPGVVAAPVGNITTESMATLRELDSAFASLVEFVEPAVVHIRVERNSNSGQMGARMGKVGGEGSGVIIRSDGWILTNDHVVGGMDKVTVVLNDGREFEGTVRRANDIQNDIAVVKIDAKDLPTARLGDSSKVRAGQFAVAVGSPFGLENSVTIGHISGLGRESQVMDQQFGGRAYSNMIQTDAPINPGNSGGPLINIEGEVIGINTSILGAGSMFGQGGNVGIGFAIPSNQARLIAETLIENGKLVRAYMGVSPDNLKPFERKELGIEGGAILREVPSDGPAASAGLKKDDVVVKIGSYKISDQQDLRNSMFRYGPGESVTVEAIRNGEPVKVNVKLIAIPQQQAAQAPSRVPERGVTPEDLFKQFRFPGEEDESEAVPPIREGKARLGVQVGELNAETRKQFSIPASAKGVVVVTVQPGSVAAKLGLAPGDVIEAFESKSIHTPDELIAAIDKVKWGETKQMRFTRYSKGTTATQDAPVTFR